MELLQNTAVSVPIPIDVYQTSGCVIMDDPGGTGFAYRVISQLGVSVPGAGVVTVGVPYAGKTKVALGNADFFQRGTMTIALEDNVAALISLAQIQSGYSLGTVACNLVDSSPAAFVIPTSIVSGCIVAAVTIASTAVLGPYSLVAFDPSTNALGSVSGRIVTTLSSGLTQADVRTAIGLAAADLDAQIAAVVAAIATRSAPGAAMTLTSGERDAVGNALLDMASGIETGCTPRQALRLLGAALGGVVTETAPGVWQFKGAGVATARITSSIPGDGSRPSMILTL